MEKRSIDGGVAALGALVRCASLGPSRNEGVDLAHSSRPLASLGCGGAEEVKPKRLLMRSPTLARTEPAVARSASAISADSRRTGRFWKTGELSAPILTESPHCPDRPPA
jgi:hypothetical protein